MARCFYNVANTDPWSLISVWFLIASMCRFVSWSKVDDAVSVIVTRDAPAQSRFLRPVSSFLKRYFALAVLLLFAVAGIWVLDDYGVGADTGFQRDITVRNLEYLLGRRDVVYQRDYFFKFYGVSYELPLLLLERALGLEDTRDVHLMRRLVTHLFFLIGGFFCYLLAYRLFGNRLLAVLAMLLFLLHPRIYAHSFFNSKDIPFLSLFMICLYLTHRTFGNGNIWRFLVLGIAVGVLINLRVMGLVLFFSIVAMCMLDLFHALSTSERIRVLGMIGAFLLSCMSALYAVSPYLWGAPLSGFVDWFNVFSQEHPISIVQVFRGELFPSGFIDPVEYVPVWFSITTPPAVLVLGIAGACLVLLRGLINPSNVLANTRLRFWFMLVGCLVLPVVGVIVLSSNVYNGWRHMYFLYAPFCLLAVFGLHWLMSMLSSTRLRAGLYGAYGIGSVVAVASMFAIHPHEHIYFNFLVDRTTPGHLRSQYDMDYWYTSLREGLEHLLETHPSTSIHARAYFGPGGFLNWQALPDADRNRMILRDESFDFYITNYKVGTLIEGHGGDTTAPLVYSRVIYGSKVLGVAAVNLSMVDDDVAAHYRDVYNATVSKRPDTQSNWDVYADDATLVYIKERCVASDFGAPFFLHVTTYDIDDLPEQRRRDGYSTRNFDFRFGMYGVRFDGKCMAVVPLPEDGISGIRTGQFTSDGELWSVAVNLRTRGESAYRAEYETVVREDPMISSEFDVYLHDGRMIYVKEPCVASDTDAEFFLHVAPSIVNDLPSKRRESGFDNLDFMFETRGLMFDGMCVASIGLPDYEIERIRTGQLIAGDEDAVVWDGGYSFVASELPRIVDGLRGRGTDPVVGSYFHVYLDDDRLIYFRSDCTDEDADAPFFVHLYPDDLDNLQPERRPLGFESFSFSLLDDGTMSDGDCFTSFDLPDYKVAGFLTGQFLRDKGNLWEDGYNFAAAELPRVVDRLRGRGVEPVIRSYFDVYMDNGRLIYVRDSCSISDTDAKFFLHVLPSSDGDLPLPLRESGFDNLDFMFETRGLMFDGMCVASIGLPDYEIERIRTGQWDPEQQRNLWKEEFDVGF